MQVFYALIAVFLLGLLSLTVQRTTHRIDSRMHVNEVVTQATGIATSIVEAIGSKPFDSKTDTLKVTTFPAVLSSDELTPKGAFGGCISFLLCQDEDDFDGLVITRTLNGFEFTASIKINYVIATNPSVLSASNTFAKEVLVEISNPTLFVGSPSNPITVPFRRVFSYQRATNI